MGRTAFRGYILTSIICTFLFYGHGLGLFGRVGRPGQLLVTGRNKPIVPVADARIAGPERVQRRRQDFRSAVVKHDPATALLVVGFRQTENVGRRIPLVDEEAQVVLAYGVFIRRPGSPTPRNAFSEWFVIDEARIRTMPLPAAIVPAPPQPRQP